MTPDRADMVRTFFDAYRAHDVERMAGLCSPGARIEYVPLGASGAGPVADIGQGLWSGLIESFPDLTNEVRSLVDDGHGQVAAEVVIGGTQAADYAGIPSHGRHYDLPHGLFFELSHGWIDRVTAYWDNASFSQQLQ